MAQYNLLNFDWDDQPSTSNRFGTHEYIWYNRTDVDGEDDAVSTIHTIIRAGIPGYSAADFAAELMLMQYQSSRTAGVVDPDSINLSVASSDNPEDEETLDMLFGDTWRTFLDTIEETARSGFADNPPTQVMEAVVEDKNEQATTEDDSVVDGSGFATSGKQITDMINQAAGVGSDDTFDPETEKELDLLYGMGGDTAEDNAEDTAEDTETDEYGSADRDDLASDVDFVDGDEDDEEDEPRGYDNDFDDEYLGSFGEDEEEEEDEEDNDDNSEVNGSTRDDADVDDVLETLRRQYGSEFVEQMISRAQAK